MKVCSRCKVEKEDSKFRIRIQYGNQYVIARCRNCEYIMNKIQQDHEKRRSTERRRFSIPDRKHKKNNFQRQWRNQNKEKNRKYHSKHIKKHVDIISDSYIVRNHFRGQKVSDVPKELIEGLRQIIKNKRLIKIKTK